MESDQQKTTPEPLYTLTEGERELIDEIQTQLNQAVGFVCRIHKIKGSVGYRDGAIWQAQQEAK